MKPQLKRVSFRLNKQITVDIDSRGRVMRHGRYVTARQLDQVANIIHTRPDDFLMNSLFLVPMGWYAIFYFTVNRVCVGCQHFTFARVLKLHALSLAIRKRNRQRKTKDAQ